MKTVDDFVVSDADTSPKTLVAVWLLLLALLALTRRLAYDPLGAGNVKIALAISVAKASLVVWYFMQLRASPKIVLFFFGMSFVLLAIGAGLIFSDYTTRG